MFGNHRVHRLIPFGIIEYAACAKGERGRAVLPGNPLRSPPQRRLRGPLKHWMSQQGLAFVYRCVCVGVRPARVTRRPTIRVKSWTFQRSSHSRTSEWTGSRIAPFWRRR